MKRSEINNIIDDAQRFFDSMNFKLPPFAFWSLDEWHKNKERAGEILESGMGWDITSFGHPDFSEQGLVLFTVRNGSVAAGGSLTKTYCEKIMIVQEKQVTPMHFHWDKTEDIINRGGGNLMIQLFMATDQELLAESSVSFQKDGLSCSVEAGGTVILLPGESITLTPYMYHTFYGESGKGPVLVGEVSKVNDDANDNRFLEPLSRFPEIEEDEEPVRLIIGDYSTLL